MSSSTDPHVGNLVQSSNGQAADPDAASSKRGPDDEPKSIKDEVSLLSVDYISKFRENPSAFIISSDLYKTYCKNAIVDQEWIEEHRIPVTYRKLMLSSGQSITKVYPTIPKDILRKKRN